MSLFNSARTVFEICKLEIFEFGASSSQEILSFSGIKKSHPEADLKLIDLSLSKKESSGEIFCKIEENPTQPSISGGTKVLEKKN